MAQVKLLKISSGTITQTSGSADSAELFSIGVGGSSLTTQPSIYMADIGATPSTPSGGSILFSASGSLYFKKSDGTLIDLSSVGGFTAGGDLSGTSSSQTVIKINGNSVAAQSLSAAQDGYVLTWSNSDGYYKAYPAAIGFTAGGDLSGTNTNQTVSKINGSTVPSGGSLTIGNVLQVSGSGALSYGAVNLAGGSNYVTGTLPIGNQDSQTLGGDLSGTTASGSVISLTGSAGVINIGTSGNVLTWNTANTSPGITQNDNTTNSATGAALTIRSQNATGTSAFGGNIVLQTGSGTSTSTYQDGYVNINTGTSSRNILSIFSLPSSINAGTWIQFADNTGSNSGAVIKVADSITNTTGIPIQLNAQNTTAALSTGGNMNISVGTGTTANGQLRIRAGLNTAIAFAVNPTGASTMSVQPTVTSFALQHNSTSTANGGALSVSSQSATGDTFNGGALNITAGSQSTSGGATSGSGGNIIITSGSTNASTSGSGGAISLLSGSATGTSTGSGGTITLTPGTSVNGAGGSLNLSCNSGATNGSINFRLGTTTFCTFLQPSPTGAVDMNWVSTITAPRIFQANASSANGSTFTLQGQSVVAGDGYTAGILRLTAGGISGSATNGTGGAVYVDTTQGSGTGSNGTLQIRCGTVTSPVTVLTITPSATVGSATGNTSIQLAAANTAFTISQADKTTNSGTGAVFTLQAQNETGTLSTGGDLVLTSGTGTTAAGKVKLRSGGTDVAMVDGNKFDQKLGQRVAIAEKSANYTLVTTDFHIATTVGNTTQTLPASPTNGDTYQVSAQYTGADLSPTIVSGNGHNIAGSSSHSISGDYESRTFTYSSTSGIWVIT